MGAGVTDRVLVRDVLAMLPVPELKHTQRIPGRIAHGSRLDQEQGLDVEDMRVQTLARLRAVCAGPDGGALRVLTDGALALAAITWLRLLGGKWGLRIDQDGPIYAAAWPAGRVAHRGQAHPARAGALPHHAFEAT